MRLNRLYDRIYHPSPLVVSSASTPLGLEPMAKDLIDDESDLSDTTIEMDFSDSVTEPPSGATALPTIEELTRFLPLLTINVIKIILKRTGTVHTDTCKIWPTLIA